MSRKILILAILYVLSGCGGRVIVPTKQAELSIPPDLAKAFEVKELPAAEVAAPEVEQPKGQNKKKRVRKPKPKRIAKTKATQQQEGVQGIAGPGEMSFAIPMRRPVGMDPLWVGEKIWMDVTWLSTKAGEFLLEVLPFKTMNGRKVYDLKGTATTTDLFALIYKAEDWVESFVDYEGWFPYKFILHGDETKHIRNNLELFDHGAKKQYVHVHDNRIQKNEIVEEKGFKDLTPLSQDSLSALYYARTQKLDDNTTITFPMTTNGSQWDTVVTVLGREEVNTKMGYLKAVKTKVETRFKGVLQQQGDAFIWFSDDERKYPLRFEAKVRIGWVAGIAKKIEPGMPLGAPAVLPPSNEAKEPSKNEKGSDAGKTSDAHAAKGKNRRWFHQLIETFSATKK